MHPTGSKMLSENALHLKIGPRFLVEMLIADRKKKNDTSSS